MPVSRFLAVIKLSFWLLTFWLIFTTHTHTQALNKVMMGYQETENVIFNQIEGPPNAESTRAGPTEEDNPGVALEDESRAENSEEVVKSTIIFNIRTMPNIQVSPGAEVETRKEKTNGQFFQTPRHPTF